MVERRPDGLVALGSSGKTGAMAQSRSAVTRCTDVDDQLSRNRSERPVALSRRPAQAGHQPTARSGVAGDLMDWLGQTESADLILWIEPAPIGDTLDAPCARYLIVGESGMLRGSVNDCAALPEVFTRTLRAAIDWD